MAPHYDISILTKGPAMLRTAFLATMGETIGTDAQQAEPADTLFALNHEWLPSPQPTDHPATR